MDRKGFTLTELLATLVVLGILLTVVIVTFNSDITDTKSKTEKIFEGTIQDAIEVYLDSDAKKLSFVRECDNVISKKHGEVKVYKVYTNFAAVINSFYSPISQSDLINPSTEEKCANAINISLAIYRDEDFVYYYKIDKSEFDCFTQNGIISTLPEGFEC